MNRDRLSDRQFLTMLDLIEVKRMTFDAVAPRFGVSRSAISGAVARIRRDADLAEAAPPPAGQVAAVRPENRDGGMPCIWWLDRRRWPE